MNSNFCATRGRQTAFTNVCFPPSSRHSPPDRLQRPFPTQCGSLKGVCSVPESWRQFTLVVVQPRLRSQSFCFFAQTDQSIDR